MTEPTYEDLVELFLDADWYLAQYPDAPPDPGAARAHFALVGSDGRSPGSLIDPGWYLAEYPDIAAAGISPVSHFLGDGWRERRMPGPDAAELVKLVLRRAATLSDAAPEPYDLWCQVVTLDRAVGNRPVPSGLTADELLWYRAISGPSAPAGSVPR